MRKLKFALILQPHEKCFYMPYTKFCERRLLGSLCCSLQQGSHTRALNTENNSTLWCDRTSTLLRSTWMHQTWFLKSFEQVAYICQLLPNWLGALQTTLSRCPRAKRISCSIYTDIKKTHIYVFLFGTLACTWRLVWACSRQIEFQSR